jgi:hypothetical protein
MPLLDHFHAPISQTHFWESFHTMWSASIAGQLNAMLPRRFLASCHVHLGRQVEADVAEFDAGILAETSGNGEGGVATAVWAPPVATHVIPAVFPDDVEVRVTDTRDGRTLVAVIEIVSPGNKDRDEARDAFAAKCAAYLQRGIGLVVVDVVTERRANLHNRLIERLRQPEEFQMDEEANLYATAYRPARRDDKNLIDLWLYRLTLGEPLPKMPLALLGAGVVPLELEETYTRARQMSRL